MPDATDPIKTTYDLAVAFGRSLLIAALPGGATELPVVSIFDEQDQKKIDLIDDYLLNFHDHPDDYKLIEDSSEQSPFERAINLFIVHCKPVLTDKFYDGDQAIGHGCRDFFTLVTLLDAPNALAVNEILESLKAKPVEDIVPTIERAS